MDGDIHNQQEEYDTARTMHLNQYGYRVVRFRNQDVLTHLDEILRQILNASSEKEDPLSNSLKI